MIDTTHMTAMPMLSFTVPGGNGLDSLTVLATDPLGYVQDEMDKRKPFDTSNEIVVPQQAGVGMGTDLAPFIRDWWHGQVQSLTASAQGLVVAVMLSLLAIVFIAFGLYQFTKD